MHSMILFSRPRFVSTLMLVTVGFSLFFPALLALCPHCGCKGTLRAHAPICGCPIVTDRGQVKKCLLRAGAAVWECPNKGHTVYQKFFLQIKQCDLHPDQVPDVFETQYNVVALYPLGFVSIGHPLDPTRFTKQLHPDGRAREPGESKPGTIPSFGEASLSSGESHRRIMAPFYPAVFQPHYYPVPVYHNNHLGFVGHSNHVTTTSDPIGHPEQQVISHSSHQPVLQDPVTAFQMGLHQVQPEHHDDEGPDTTLKL